MAKPISEHDFSAEMCLTRSELRLFRDEPDGLSVPVSGGSVPRFDKEKMRRVLELAEHDLAAEIPFCPASLYIRFIRDGNRSEYERVYFRRREMALRLALAEAYEKQGRFTDKLMDAVWAIMEESTWTVPAHLAMYSPSHGDRGLAEAYTGELLHAIDLFSAATGALLATVYLLDKDALDGCTPVICEKMKYEVVHRQLEPFLQFDYPWSGLRGNPVNNSRTCCLPPRCWWTTTKRARRSLPARRSARTITHVFSLRTPAATKVPRTGTWRARRFLTASSCCTT